MYVKVNDHKLAIGTLSIDIYPQIQFDLVLNKESELTHTSKTTSVFFSSYKVVSAPSPFVGFDELNDNTINDLTSLLNVKQELSILNTLE